MPAFTVTNAELKKAVQGQHGPMQVIALDLRDSDGKEQAAEWFTKASTQIPGPGTVLDGTVELTDYGWKFKKTPPAGGFGGSFRPRDPKESAAIVRQHSQGIAVKLVELGMTAGVIVPPKDGKELFALIAKTCDWLDRDVAAAKEKA